MHPLIARSITVDVKGILQQTNRSRAKDVEGYRKTILCDTMAIDLARCPDIRRYQPPNRVHTCSGVHFATGQTMRGTGPHCQTVSP